MTLDGVGGDYIINLLKRKAPTTTYPSIIYNSNTFNIKNKSKYAKDAEIIIKRLKDLKLTARILGHTRSIRSMNPDPTGQILISGSQDTNIKAWHVPSISIIKSFKGHDEPVLQTEISPDRRMIASIGEDSTLRLWSLENGAAVAMCYMHDANSINEICFSPLNDLIACGTESGIMRILKIAELPGEIKTLDKKFEQGQFYDLVQLPDVYPDTDDFIEFPQYDPMDFIKKPLTPIIEKGYRSPITVINDKYAPVELSSLQAHAIIPSHVIHCRAAEIAWAAGSPELRTDQYHKSRPAALRCKTVKLKELQSISRSASLNLKQAQVFAAAPPPPPPPKESSSSASEDEEAHVSRGRGRPKGSKNKKLQARNHRKRLSLDLSLRILHLKKLLVQMLIENNIIFKKMF